MGGTVFHEVLDLRDGYVQLPEQEDCFQLLAYAGEDGVAAYGILMYVNFIFSAAYIGFSVGVAPIIGYHYGAGGFGEMKSLFKKSLKVIGAFALLMFASSLLLARPLSLMFVSYDEKLLAMTLDGFSIFFFFFLFAGFAIFGSGFFTALNDGLTSALISSLRTLIFQVASVLILPLIWGLDGIWLSVVAAELLAALTAAAFLVGKRRKYRY